MIICPNCRHEEVAGSLFCTECGAQLITTGHLTTHSIRRNLSEPLSPQRGGIRAEVPIPPSGVKDPILSLNLMDSGEIVYLTGKSEFTLGRVSEGQPILPDVDLSPYEAYAQGVSRLHASIKVINNAVFITDLGSSNGTRINGQKIVPHIEYPVNHGDIIALGRLKIQALVRKQHSAPLG
jgi:pSer/pThr/pTyr-binding forkhead associated (FHA) protein